MIAAIYNALGPVHFTIGLLVLLTITTIVLSWIAYFIARAWTRGMQDGYMSQR